MIFHKAFPNGKAFFLALRSLSEGGFALRSLSEGGFALRSLSEGGLPSVVPQWRDEGGFARLSSFLDPILRNASRVPLAHQTGGKDHPLKDTEVITCPELPIGGFFATPQTILNRITNNTQVVEAQTRKPAQNKVLYLFTLRLVHQNTVAVDALAREGRSVSAPTHQPTFAGLSTSIPDAIPAPKKNTAHCVRRKRLSR
ncbi:MAG TPA: hypothetical protein DCE81_09400 [Cytophagales bacterium]|nr:hypothetical protein [Cytophagales bacterium]